MTNDYIAPIIARLTYNGATNLVGTLRHPDPDYPDMINGRQRIYTGFGKWTTIAAQGVENHLIALGLAEPKKVGEDRLFEILCITPLGREVAEYVDHAWDDVAPNLRDCSQR